MKEGEQGQRDGQPESEGYAGLQTQLEASGMIGIDT